VQTFYLFISVDTALGLFYHAVAAYHDMASRDYVTALKFSYSGLALAISIGSSKRHCSALYHLAMVKKASGDFVGATKDASESQRVAKIAGNLHTEASALAAEGSCWAHLGSYGRSISLLDRAIHLLDLCGLSGGAAHRSFTITQAEVHRHKSEYEEARDIQTHLLHNASADQDPYHHAFALSNIAQIDIEIGGFQDDVQQNINTAAAIFHRANFSVGVRWCDMYRAALEVRQGNLIGARSHFQICLRHAWGKDTEGVMYCLEELAAVEQWSPSDSVLFAWPVTFFVHSVKLKERRQLHKALQFLGDVFWAQGDQETASCLFTVALEGFTQMDVHRSRAECIVRLGDLSTRTGDELKAIELWETARPLFKRSLQGKQLINLDVKLAKLRHNQSQV
jgi:tetratricopeptide (TPR) repeat protein